MTMGNSDDENEEIRLTENKYIIDSFLSPICVQVFVRTPIPY